mgnify:CR=1 FL=1
MDETAARIDDLMERASRALVDRSYVACERLCVEAIELAHGRGDYDRLARITLPLQECRRQLRQMAEEAGTVVLAGPREDVAAVVERLASGCVLLTDPPYTAADARAVRESAREGGKAIEAVCLDGEGLTAMFCRAMEDAGDRLLAEAADEPDPVKRVDWLLARLDQVSDHEIAHQRLAEAARRAAGAASAAARQPSDQSSPGADSVR